MSYNFDCLVGKWRSVAPRRHGDEGLEYDYPSDGGQASRRESHDQDYHPDHLQMVNAP